MGHQMDRWLVMPDFREKAFDAIVAEGSRFENLKMRCSVPYHQMGRSLVKPDLRAKALHVVVVQLCLDAAVAWLLF